MYRDFAYRIINSINQASLVTPHVLVAAALIYIAEPRHIKGRIPGSLPYVLRLPRETGGGTFQDAEKL